MAVPARRLPREAHRRHLRAVPGGSRGRGRKASARRARRSPAEGRRRVPFVIFSLVVVAAMVTLLASVQALVAESSFRTTALQHRAARLEHQVERLHLRTARLSSPERLADAARDLGLVLPDEVRLIRVKGGRT